MRTFNVIAFLATFLFFSCEKVIELVPEEQPPKLVVDGYIESGQPPRVIITRSLAYFDKLTPTMLTESFVRNADVRVSDGLRSVRLREYGIPIPGGTVFFYSVDTSNPAALMLGEFNKTYKLTISKDGETFEANTTIPDLTKKSDSLWWEPAPNNPDTNRVVVFARVADPPGLGNYIRYYTSRNDSAYFPGLNSVFDDNIVDGITYEIQVFRGQDRNQEFDQDEFGFFRRGDRVKVKLTNIDKATYDFWRTWEQNQQNVGNPFSVPIKVLSNISNGAIGIWGGYAAQELSLNIPR
ncbi:MAG: DUF4249 domain-containing protein [Chitinophagaceae bacterium]|jgi:hypothetical protein|nr:DUF4249 domain-containing protein [Chitinophagaceae bacterium]